MPEDQPAVNWTEENSQQFLDYGRYFVPEREAQFRILCDLIPAVEDPFVVLELCCGEGLLAGMVLERYPQASVYALDGSAEMLVHARANLAGFSPRFRAERLSLQDTSWRTPTAGPLNLPKPPQAVLSSLAIHHLDMVEKAALYRDLFGMLAPGGALLIADMIYPPDAHWREVTAVYLDESVRQRSEAVDGDRRAYEFFTREQWNIYRFPDEMDKPSPILEQLVALVDAGFIHPDVFWMKAGHAIYGGIHP